MSKIVFSRLSTKELDFIANGCGPKFLGFLVPDKLFRPACIRHDVAYYIGGDEEDRRRADREFYLHMLRLADRQYWRRYWRWRARVYYSMVRTLGRYIAFHYGEQRTYEQLVGEMSYYA